MKPGHLSFLIGLSIIGSGCSIAAGQGGSISTETSGRLDHYSRPGYAEVAVPSRQSGPHGGSKGFVSKSLIPGGSGAKITVGGTVRSGGLPPLPPSLVRPGTSQTPQSVRPLRPGPPIDQPVGDPPRERFAPDDLPEDPVVSVVPPLPDVEEEETDEDRESDVTSPEDEETALEDSAPTPPEDIEEPTSDLPDESFDTTPDEPADLDLPTDDFDDAGGGLGSLDTDPGFGELGQLLSFSTPEVFGDMLGRGVLGRFVPIPNPPPPLPTPGVPPNPPTPSTEIGAPAPVPSIRGIKIAENQSPVPRDRVFYQMNYFNNVNESINQRFGFPLSGVQVYRHIFGIEKTLFNKKSSIGVRLPLNTVTGDSPLPGIGRTTTSLGDLNIFFKHVLLSNEETGRLLSAGLSVTAPTGPGRFAGADYLEDLQDPLIQPFVGTLLSFNRFYFQGFTSIEVPFNPNNVTILYNDYSVGYFLYQTSDESRFLRAIIPTFEVHVNTPLNHRGSFFEDPASTPDFINLTYGTAFQFGQSARFLAGIATPVTGPRPFDLEVIAALNVFY